MTSSDRLHFQLGALGVSWEEAQAMMHDLMDVAAAKHSMGAQARRVIPGTCKQLCYDNGTDGFDAKWWIEDVPDVHVDWHMTFAEWEELRFALWRGPVTEGSYIGELRRSGKLGDDYFPDYFPAQ